MDEILVAAKPELKIAEGPVAKQAHKGRGGKRSFSDLLPPRLFVRAAILWKLQGIWTQQS